MPTSKGTTRWRASGSYLPTLSSKTSLLEETRQFLLTYARLGDSEATRLSLVNSGLLQRSRAARAIIVNIVQLRLTRWNPPSWVLDDLIGFAQDGHSEDAFDAIDIPGYEDGDWPLWPLQEMLDWMPKDIQQRFGKVVPSAVNGDCLELISEKADEIVKALESRGFSCAEDESLVMRACGYI